MSTGEIVDDDPFGIGEEPAETIGDAPDSEFGSRVRFSRLKLLGKSPAHYFANPQGESAALDRGTAVHSMLLRGARVTFYPKKTADGKSAPRRGKEWDAFKLANSGATIVTASEYDVCSRMVDAVRANHHAMEVLTGIMEETILFDWLGLDCRSTPDVRDPAGAFVTELKTCQTSDPGRFSWQSIRMGYHGQMAFHRAAMRKEKLGHDPIGYVVAVESTIPYPVTVFKMTDRAWEKGEKQVRFWMEQLKSCLQSNQWPPYAQSVVDLDVPDEDAFADVATFSADNLPADW